MNLILIFLLSLVFHTVIFNCVLNFELIGKNIKGNLSFLIKNRPYLFTISYYISIFIFIICLNLDIIYLDSKVQLTTTVNNTTVEINGDVLKLLLEHQGTAAVWIAGAKITHLLVAKQPMAIPNKILSIGLGATGLSTLYRITHRTLQNDKFLNAQITGSTGPIKIELSTNIQSSSDSNLREFLSQLFGLDQTNINQVISQLPKTLTNNNNLLQANLSSSEYGSIINTLNKEIPNWRDSFKVDPKFADNFSVDSAIEFNESAIKFIRESIMDSVVLDIISAQFSFTLLTIIICKFLLSSNISFDRLNKYRLGTYISKMLKSYISLWQRSSNIWIFSIIILLILFNIASAYSLLRVLSLTIH